MHRIPMLPSFSSPGISPRTGRAAREFYSPRSDVPAPAGLPPLSNYRLEERYAEFVSNEAQVADLRARLGRYTGPVTNTGGVK